MPDNGSSLNNTMDTADICLELIKRGHPQRSMIYCGHRRSEMARLLDIINAAAEAKGIKCYHFKSRENNQLIRKLIQVLSKSEYQLDSGDLTELLLESGKAAQLSENAICLLINDIHELSCNELQELLAAQHRCNQLGLPVITFCTGLPIAKKRLGMACSYAERMFIFYDV